MAKSSTVAGKACVWLPPVDIQFDTRYKKVSICYDDEIEYCLLEREKRVMRVEFKTLPWKKEEGLSSINFSNFKTGGQRAGGEGTKITRKPAKITVKCQRFRVPPLSSLSPPHSIDL